MVQYLVSAKVNVSMTFYECLSPYCVYNIMFYNIAQCVEQYRHMICADINCLVVKKQRLILCI